MVTFIAEKLTTLFHHLSACWQCVTNPATLGHIAREPYGNKRELWL